jgi:chemotaxis protein CheZ
MDSQNDESEQTANRPSRVVADVGMSQQDNEVLGELREISEKLHSSLHHLHLDSTLVAITKEKIPEAMNGLDYVIEKTRDAAEKTLDMVEDSMPLAADLNSRALSLQEQWEQLRRRDLDFEQFKPLSDALARFFVDVREKTGKLGANLSEILLAQEFQDLTGQVVRRVMDDVKSVDEQLRRVTTDLPRDAIAEGPQDATIGRGPVVGSCKDKNFASDQNEVDDILSELDL